MPDESSRGRSPIRWADVPASISASVWRYSIWLCWKALHWRRAERGGTAKALVADRTIAVPLSSLVDLAVEAWRLRRSVAERDAGQSNAVGRFVARRLAAFLSQLELETVDLTGHRYEPGLALELVGNVSDSMLQPDTVLIDEMVAPLCLWRGKVVRFGQAVTRSAPVLTSLGQEP